MWDDCLCRESAMLEICTLGCYFFSEDFVPTFLTLFECLALARFLSFHVSDCRWTCPNRNKIWSTVDGCLRLVDVVGTFSWTIRYVTCRCGVWFWERLRWPKRGSWVILFPQFFLHCQMDLLFYILALSHQNAQRIHIQHRCSKMRLHMD